MTNHTMSSLNLDKHSPNGRPTQSEHESLLSTQLSLELQLRQHSQELLNLYRNSQDWPSVSQLAQSLVTNSQRIATLKELLSKESQSSVRPFLQTIRESKSPEPEKTITDIPQSETQELSLSTTETSESSSRTSSEEPLLSLFDKGEELVLLAENTTAYSSKQFGNGYDYFPLCTQLSLLDIDLYTSVAHSLLEMTVCLCLLLYRQA